MGVITKLPSPNVRCSSRYRRLRATSQRTPARWRATCHRCPPAIFSFTPIRRHPKLGCLPAESDRLDRRIGLRGRARLNVVSSHCRSSGIPSETRLIRTGSITSSTSRHQRSRKTARLQYVPSPTTPALAIPDHLAAAVLCHSIPWLAVSSTALQYIFYLEQIGVAMSLLGNNALLPRLRPQPFHQYFRR